MNKKEEKQKFPDFPYVCDEQKKNYELFFKHYLSTFDYKEDTYAYISSLGRFINSDKYIIYSDNPEELLDEFRFAVPQFLLSEKVSYDLEKYEAEKKEYKAAKGLKLKDAAQREGLKMEQVAMMIGVSKPMLYKYINGKTPISLEKLLMLSVILKEEVTNLLTFDNLNVRERVDGSVQLIDLESGNRTSDVIRLRDEITNDLPLVALKFPNGIPPLGLNGNVTLIATDEEKYLPMIKKETLLILRNKNGQKYYQSILPGRKNRKGLLKTVFLKSRSGQINEKDVSEVSDMLAYIVVKQIIS